MAAICVYCSSSTKIDQRYVDLAAEVGSAIAERGHSLVSGGGDLSCMGAVARAARAGGAKTLGVIPRGLLELEVGDQDADELLIVDDMRTRKGLMDARSDAFLTLPGGLGTLEELLEVWVARFLGMHTKPVVALDPDGLFAPLRQQVALLVEKGFVRQSAVDALHWTTSTGEALDLLEQHLGDARMTPAPEEVLESVEGSDTC
ncbi:MAG: TIGR00730 family Rossman fold protein [Actinobacteria bacterium]|nr:TIGR00730 family Rossman fold protein [Actinomycetota bacterium]MCA1721810.1 TIGR00730 family Rossman fold protein [Actinomycetota bacterium]